MKSDEEIAAERERALQIKEQKEKISKERKMRMRELEARAAVLAKKTDEEVAQAAKEDAIRRLAAEKIDSESDVVKLLSSISARAAAFTIREKQLEEKKRRELAEHEYERRMDIVMELDRLKDIQRREEEESAKRYKRVEDRKVITEQIEMRKREKLIQLEAREQENLQMRSLMEKYAKEDQVAAEKKKIEIERSRLEVIAANTDAIRRKEAAKEASKKEVEDLLLYQAEQDAKLLKREQEEAAIEKAKKERQAKLLAEQERVHDNMGKLDEIRARRAQEEKERRERQAEREAALKRKADVKQLVEARARQAADKKERLARSKLIEEQEYMDALRYTQSVNDREESERITRTNAINQYRRDLQAQIEQIQRERHKYVMHNFARLSIYLNAILTFMNHLTSYIDSNRSGNNDEGTRARQQAIADIARLSAVRDKMVSDLEAKGVNPKYLTEMKNVDIAKILLR
jgi:hypothetical protein